LENKLFITTFAQIPGLEGLGDFLSPILLMVLVIKGLNGVRLVKLRDGLFDAFVHFKRID
jgi:hypothetical protein